MTKMWRVIDLLNETQKYFKNKGISSSRLDAELLLAYCLKKDRVGLYMDFESPVTPHELSTFRDLVRRRAKREPVAYIVGQKEFWSMNVLVNQEVLIPRPETEILVEEVSRNLKTDCIRGGRKRILDIGTGSGAVSLALAKDNDDIVIYSVDISFGALTVAQKNIDLHGMNEKIALVCGDALTPFKNYGSFDMIISNPPYVPGSDIDLLEPEIRDFEPRSALDGGMDGLDFYRQLIPNCPVLLQKQGLVALEIGDGQAGAVSQIFESCGSYEDVRVVRDHAGKERVLIGKKGE